MKKEIQSRQVTKVINLIKLSTMRTLKLIVMAMTLVVGCQKFDQNNTDNPKDPTEQQGSNKDTTDKKDKGNKPDDQQAKPRPIPTFATGWIPNTKKIKNPGATSVRVEKGKERKVRLEGFPYSVDAISYYNQYTQFSCTSHGIAMSLSWQINYKRRHLALSDREFLLSRSYLYNQIKDVGSCDSAGSGIEETYNLIIERGIPREIDFPFDYTTCSALPTPKVNKLAGLTKIKGYDSLELTYDSFTGILSQGIPIVVGANINAMFHSLFYDGGDYIYNEENYFKGGEITGYHVMLVISYDRDEGPNGTITLLNSWGAGGFNRTGYVKIDANLIGQMITAAYYVSDDKLYDYYAPYNEIPTPNPTPQPTPQPSVSTNSSYINFSSEVEASQREQLTIYNSGDAVANISLNIEGNIHCFQLGSENIILYPNNHTAVEIIYSPQKEGDHNATLVLTINGRDIQRVSLTGRAKRKEKSQPNPFPTPEPNPEPRPTPAPEPRISISTNYLSFQTELGNTSKQDLILSNTGNATAQVYLHTEGDSFRIENQSYILEAGSQQRISIIYQPQNDGYHRGTLVVNYNNLTESVNLQGYAERKRDDDNHNHDDPQPTYYTIKEVPAAQDATIECPDEGLPKTHSGKGKIALRDLKVTEVGAGNLQVTGRLVKEDTERFTQRGEIYVKYGKFCENNKEKIGSYNSGDSSVDLIFFVSKAKINNKIYILTKSLENKTNRLFTNIVIELVRN